MPKKHSKPRKPRKPRGNPPPGPESPAQAPTKAEPVATGKQSRKILPSGHVLTEEFLAQQWKPGESGNPSGRPRKISDPLEEFLNGKVPNDPEKRTYLKVLIEAAVKRAITKSDTLVQEIFNRVEGKVTQAEDEKAAAGMKVILIDVPRPDRSVINVTPGRAAVAGGASPAPPIDPRPKD